MFAHQKFLPRAEVMDSRQHTENEKLLGWTIPHKQAWYLVLATQNQLD